MSVVRPHARLTELQPAAASATVKSGNQGVTFGSLREAETRSVSSGVAKPAIERIDECETLAAVHGGDSMV